MSILRKATADEQRLLDALVNQAKALILSPNWKDALLVQTMDDGGMGSILLFPNGPTETKRLLGSVASELKFPDDDGGEVLASLNLDCEGELFEVDVWKVNFSPLIRIPEEI